MPISSARLQFLYTSKSLESSPLFFAGSYPSVILNQASGVTYTVGPLKFPAFKKSVQLFLPTNVNYSTPEVSGRFIHA